MIRFGSVPHSDSVLLSAVSVARILRSAGHEFRIALDESASSYSLMHKLAQQLGEDIVPLEVLCRDKPDAVFFESSIVAPHAFKDIFRINFAPGIFQHQRFYLFRMNTFALGNFTFAPNYVAPYIADLYGADIPALGIPSADLLSALKPDKTIVFPDSFPMTVTGRKKWFSILEEIARANPDYELVIKERFSKEFFSHIPFPSFSTHFSETTPDSIRIADYTEDTRELLARASYIVGVISGVLVEAALVGKKVCLIKADLSENPMGRPLGKDWFFEKRLRSSLDAAVENLNEACLLTPDSLSEFMPTSFNREWFVEALEGIFDWFPDSESRNSLKFNLDCTKPLDEQLRLLKQRAGSPEDERQKSLIHYEYAATVSRAAMMVNLITPDISTFDLTSLIKKYILQSENDLSVESARLRLARCMDKLSEVTATEFYQSEKVDYLLGEEMSYETPYLIPGFHISDALNRLNRSEDAKLLSKKIYDNVTSKEENMLASYVNAVALRRMGRIDYAVTLFKKIIESRFSEKTLKSGAFFHLGDIALADDNKSEAAVYFSRCLEIEPKHCKAKELLEGCLN
ncbi:hypothetical protein [Maridesulfovibrio hydrothermalis]|uniref:Uncharacterized protein n=1 Tax=Maridesulfovibrio hydrothermalis AM13 = DSM 14728 TaxID=1121451 RepID=L0RB70_9BACT|nr:hypothetical protein [Maridesulfovibrio hydrothermalis]CCO23462.1 protein of unknown function [Maridesulfovibrio hydrothermalis AM13 = DSM 14728]